MIVVKEEGEEYEIIEEWGIDQKELNAPKIVEESQVVVELSINYVVGLSNLGKMKVKEMIQGKVAIILIDCGVTRNFISEKNSERVVTEYKRNVKLWSHFGLGHCSQREGNLWRCWVNAGRLEGSEWVFTLEVGRGSCHTWNAVIVFLGNDWSGLEESDVNIYISGEEGDNPRRSEPNQGQGLS